ncbi:hypothetical protein CQA38_05085 [Campylobacter sp. MIT 12-5580]|nr:hypothetical protein CQA38_05085 [Campylobacter sp. MIT 12-5580]
MPQKNSDKTTKKQVINLVISFIIWGFLLFYTLISSQGEVHVAFSHFIILCFWLHNGLYPLINFKAFILFILGLILAFVSPIYLFKVDYRIVLLLYFLSVFILCFIFKRYRLALTYLAFNLSFVLVYLLNHLNLLGSFYK